MFPARLSMFETLDWSASSLKPRSSAKVAKSTSDYGKHLIFINNLIH